MFTSGKDGISALSLQRTLEIGSYQTAWAMLHRLRSVLVAPGRDRLSGTVEVDETYIGGEEPGVRGGRAKGKKALVCVAVEVTEPRGFGRCRMAIVADGTATSLHSFVADHVEPGTKVITDAWQGYSGIDKLGYTHERRSQRAARARGEDPGELLPAVHRVASLAKRWLLVNADPKQGQQCRLKTGPLCVFLLCRISGGLVALEPVAGAFQAEDVGVVDDSVDHRGGDGGVAEDLAPANERLLVRIRDACS